MSVILKGPDKNMLEDRLRCIEGDYEAVRSQIRKKSGSLYTPVKCPRCGACPLVWIVIKKKKE